MENYRNRINIMTSCDDNLTKYIFVQLRTIAMHLRDKEVHFYILYHRIPEESLRKLEKYCDCFSNITFHRIFIQDIEPYIIFAKNGAVEQSKKSNPDWPYEAYFSLGCHGYLPSDVDRILYIDAGDVLFTGEIDEFYFDDFEDKYLIVSARFIKDTGEYFTSNDLHNENFLKTLRQGIFNSGSYVINVELLRSDRVAITKILDIVELLPEHETETKYRSDEALLTIAFVNKTKCFEYNKPQMRNQLYNHLLGYYRVHTNKYWEKPLVNAVKIIHFVGTDIIKPWKFLEFLICNGLIDKTNPILLNDILEIASNTTYGDLKVSNQGIKDNLIITKEMIPFYAYWFKINSIVENDFEKIFK